jgi:hypothetical protein
VSMMWIGILQSLVLPVAAAATLPLSYRNPKPSKALWGIGFGLAVFGIVGVAIAIYFLSAVSGMNGNATDVTDSAASLSLYIGAPAILILLSPFVIAWLLYEGRDSWSGIIRPFALEAVVVFAILAAVPLGVSMWWIDQIQDAKEASTVAKSTPKSAP